MASNVDFRVCVICEAKVPAGCEVPAGFRLVKWHGDGIIVCEEHVPFSSEPFSRWQSFWDLLERGWLKRRRRMKGNKGHG